VAFSILIVGFYVLILGGNGFRSVGSSSERSISNVVLLRIIKKEYQVEDELEGNLDRWGSFIVDRIGMVRI